MSNDDATPWGVLYQLGARGRPFYDKNNQQSNAETHKAEGILEGESLHIGVLGVGGRHGDARERATMPRRAECSCSVDIEFIAF